MSVIERPGSEETGTRAQAQAQAQAQVLGHWITGPLDWSLELRIPETGLSGSEPTPSRNVSASKTFLSRYQEPRKHQVQ